MSDAELIKLNPLWEVTVAPWAYPSENAIETIIVVAPDYVSATEIATVWIRETIAGDTFWNQVAPPYFVVSVRILHHNIYGDSRKLIAGE